MKTKNLTFKVKASGTDGGLKEGQFDAYASVFDVIDGIGDVVRKGAFTDSLAEWKSSGLPIPLLWSHNMADPDFNLGIADAKEDDYGLLVRGTFDMESPKAAQAYRLVKSGRVNQMSFAYDILDGGPAEMDGRDIYELRKLKVHEISLTPIGMNQETEVLAVKSAVSALLKEGRVLAQKHITKLKDAHTALGEVIAAAEKVEDGKAAGQPSAKPEEPDGAKGEEPKINPLVVAELQLLSVIDY